MAACVGVATPRCSGQKGVAPSSRAHSGLVELLVADDHDDLRHVNQALLILARAAQWEEALCVFLHRIERLKVKVDIVSVNSVALALANVARWQRALALTQPWWPLATDGGTARAICMLS
eukprot:g22269.t2